MLVCKTTGKGSETTEREVTPPAPQCGALCGKVPTVATMTNSPSTRLASTCVVSL